MRVCVYAGMTDLTLSSRLLLLVPPLEFVLLWKLVCVHRLILLRSSSGDVHSRSEEYLGKDFNESKRQTRRQMQRHRQRQRGGEAEKHSWQRGRKTERQMKT